MIRLAIFGATGRMGRILCRLVCECEDLELVAAVDSRQSPNQGKTVSELMGLPGQNVTIACSLDADADVVVDFSLPDGTMEAIDTCLAKGIPLVTGTTGLDPGQLSKLHDAATRIPVVWESNMSVGINVLGEILGRLGALLGPDFDVEIVELHHNRKADSPSGTAIKLAEAVCKGVGLDMATEAVYGRQGQVGERPEREIGIHAVRGGDIVGEHTVYFAGPGERVEVTHKASSRETFAQGGLRAARWVAGRKPGLYRMKDVLGIGSQD